MPAASSNAARIREIQDILRSGVKVSEVDGTRVEYDHASLRKELTKLLRQTNRPVAAGIYTGGF